MENQIQITENELPIYEQAQRAGIDMQIATAKKFPRDISRSTDNCIAIMTMSKSIAQTAGYSLPRGGKKIRGASVHLARVLAQNWGNIRVQVHGGMISDKYVTAEAVAFDLETNYAVSIEARRKILDKHGKRFNDDMINTTMQACMAVAERNAILKIIPKSVIDNIYDAAMNVITGNISTEAELIARRTKMLDYFKNQYAATEAEILKVVGKASIQAITKEDIGDLIGLDQAFKDNETTPDETFGRVHGENKDPEAEKAKAQEFYEEEKEDKKEDK